MNNDKPLDNNSDEHPAQNNQLPDDQLQDVQREDSLRESDISEPDLNEPELNESERDLSIENETIHIETIDTKNGYPETISLSDLKPITLGEPSLQGAFGLQVFLALVVIVNFSLLFLKGYHQDLGYWQDWVGQLSTRGYENFNGNYPPFYVHWLYVVGKLYTWSGIPLEHNDLLKFLTQFPVMLSHCLLTSLVYCELHRHQAPRYFAYSLLLLTALNPAILVNGPIWGQVDLIPVTLVICALLLSLNKRYCIFSIPIFAVALLTKFQMIAFAPVFGFLFFRHIVKNLVGIVIACALSAIIFLPSIIAGHFWQAIKQAYVDTLGQYPMTTFNAANLWVILTSNIAPDNIQLIKFSDSPILTKAFTAKYFGMLLFSITALGVFLHGIYFQIKHQYLCDDRLRLSQIFLAAMICAVAFFTLLPAMHERYLFPATAVALLFSAFAQRKILYPILISVICSLNMLIILELNGSDIWSGLAWLLVSVFGLSILELIFGDALFRPIKIGLNWLFRQRYFFVGFLILSSSIMLTYFFNHYKPHDLELAENQRLLTDFPLVYAKQDYGTMGINRSYDGNRLSLAGRYYAQGIGTHANSDIQYRLPENAIEFSFIPGLDDETITADVQFSVWGDGKLLWKSQTFYGFESDVTPVKIDVSEVTLLNLKVAALKDDKWDHADWVYPIITLGDQMEPSSETDQSSETAQESPANSESTNNNANDSVD